MEPAQPADRGPDTQPDLRPVPAAADSEPAPHDDEPVGRDGRSERSPKDMAISLLVLLVPIALIFGFYRVFLGGDQPVVIDPAPAVAQARTAGAFTVSEPAGLGDSWRTVTANFTGADGAATLRIGYVSPEGAGVQVVQTDVPVETLLPTELTEDGQPQGATEIDGQTWQRYTARPGERALVLLEPDRTILVVGAAAEAELRALAAALN